MVGIRISLNWKIVASGWWFIWIKCKTPVPKGWERILRKILGLGLRQQSFFPPVCSSIMYTVSWYEQLQLDWVLSVFVVALCTPCHDMNSCNWTGSCQCFWASLTYRTHFSDHNLWGLEGHKNIGYCTFTKWLVLFLTLIELQTEPLRNVVLRWSPWSL